MPRINYSCDQCGKSYPTPQKAEQCEKKCLDRKAKIEQDSETAEQIKVSIRNTAKTFDEFISMVEADIQKKYPKFFITVKNVRFYETRGTRVSFDTNFFRVSDKWNHWKSADIIQSYGIDLGSGGGCNQEFSFQANVDVHTLPLIHECVMKNYAARVETNDLAANIQKKYRSLVSSDDRIMKNNDAIREATIKIQKLRDESMDIVSTEYTPKMVEEFSKHEEIICPTGIKVASFPEKEIPTIAGIIV